MKIFGIEFGKKGGDDHEDDHFMTKLGDRRYRTDKSEKSKLSSKDSPDPDDIIKDSLRTCYKPHLSEILDGNKKSRWEREPIRTLFRFLIKNL